MRKHWKWLVAVLLLGAFLVWVKLKPVEVEAHTAKAQDIVAEVMGTGTLDARVKTVVSPRIQERLAEVLVDEGDYARQGQLLARLDDRELRGQVQVAEAALAAAKATAERVRVDEARAEAVERQAGQDHKRIVELVATKVSSQSDLDKAVEQLRVSESDLRRARAATLEAGQQVVTAEKNLAYYQERLQFAEIRSPFDGLVTRRDRDPGGVVVPGSSLLHVVSTNEIWVSAWVDETSSACLREGQPARVVFRAQPRRAYEGEVARLGRETDRETREFLVDVRIKELPPNWTIGQRAEVFIGTEQKAQVLTVPSRFIEWRDGRPGVFVAQQGKANWRPVTLGIAGAANTEVSEGIKAGEQVVAPLDRKASKLKNGQRLKVRSK